MTDLTPAQREEQVLRTLDKADKIGVDGFIALLQEPPEKFGAGLDRFRAEWIGSFRRCTGRDNDETIANLRAWFEIAPTIRRRLDLMCALAKQTDAGGTTAWDRLLNMPDNDDQSWRDGGRPANIGWALDDLGAALAKREGGIGND